MELAKGAPTLGERLVRGGSVGPRYLAQTSVGLEPEAGQAYPAGSELQKSMKTIFALSLAFLTLLGPAAIGVAHAQPAAPNSLQSMDYAFLGGHRTAIKLVFKRNLKDSPTVFTMYYPGVRVVLDFDDMRSAVAHPVLDVVQRDLLTLRVVHSRGHTRVIIRLTRPLIRKTEITGHDLLIMLHRPEQG